MPKDCLWENHLFFPPPLKSVKSRVKDDVHFDGQHYFLRSTKKHSRCAQWEKSRIKFNIYNVRVHQHIFHLFRNHR